MLESLALSTTCSTSRVSRNEIKYIPAMLERGTGADRQLNVFRETGSPKAVVDYLAEETREGI